MSDTKNAIVDSTASIATPKSASWANWVVGVQGPLLGLILLCVIFTFTTNVFFSVRNALNVLDQVTVLGILAVGMTLVIVIGGIDLSVGSVLAFVMMVMGWLKETFNVPVPLAILIGLLCGGVFLSRQAEARVMLPRRQGSIVNIASMSGSIVNRGIQQIHYNTSKAGVIHLTKSLAMERCDRGIRANAISPGYTLTPMNARPEVADQRKQFEADTPLGRMATVDELVGPAVFLLSAAASFCTGVDLVVDGGFVCW